MPQSHETTQKSDVCYCRGKISGVYLKFWGLVGAPKNKRLIKNFGRLPQHDKNTGNGPYTCPMHVYYIIDGPRGYY